MLLQQYATLVIKHWFITLYTYIRLKGKIETLVDKSMSKANMCYSVSKADFKQSREKNHVSTVAVFYRSYKIKNAVRAWETKMITCSRTEMNYSRYFPAFYLHNSITFLFYFLGQFFGKCVV